MSQLWNPFDAEHVAEPFSIFRRLRDDHPLYHNAELGFFALSRYDDVAAANADWQTYTSAEGVDLDDTGSLFFGAGNFVEEDPPLHTGLRRVVRHHLTPRRVVELAPDVGQKAAVMAAEVAERLVAGEEVDIVADLCLPLPLGVIGDLLGLSADLQDYVYERFLAMFERESGSVAIPAAAMAAAGEVRATLRVELERRREDPHDDLLTEIATGQLNDRPMTVEEQVGMSTLIVGAGISTTKNLLSNIFAYVAADPLVRHQLESVRHEPHNAIEEFLRYDSPIQNSTRVATRDVVLHGTVVPAGSRITLVYGSANRDERRFARPDELQLDRDVRRHFAFGGGLHMCVGAPLARMETAQVIEHALPLLPPLRATGQHIRSLKMNERGFESLVLVAT